jgi:phosphonate transport system substrate-binding protein
MFRSNLRIKIFLAAFLFILGCSDQEPPKKINLAEKTAASPQEKIYPRDTLRVAIGGMITPKEGFAYYKKFLDYLGEHLQSPLQLVDRENYAEINQMIKYGDVDLAFVCGGPYVAGHDEFGMELLVAPRTQGGTVYYSYIIVPASSPITSFEDLRGKKFAFTDPMSNSGKLVPTYMLARMNETPDTFFSRYDYAWSHDKAIQAVAYSMVDGAAVDSLIWEYLNETNPGLTSLTKVIEKSPPYGIPPVVVRHGLPLALKNRLKQIFLEAHTDEQGKAILEKMMIEKFVPIDDSAYDSIREMNAWVAAKSSGKKVQ